MRSVSLLERFGVVDETPEVLVDRLADTPPKQTDMFSEAVYESPEYEVKENLVAMEQLEEACCMFESLVNQGGVNQMLAVAMEDLHDYQPVASLESFTTYTSTRNYQISLEGVFSAIGRGIKKFWEMVKSFFRWLFRLDRKSKAQQLSDDIAKTNEAIKNTTTKLKESLDKVAEQQRQKTAQLVKDVTENLAKAELGLLHKKYAINIGLTDHAKTWASIDQIIDDYGKYEKRYETKDEKRAKLAGGVARAAEALRARVGRCFTTPGENKPHQFERASIFLRENKKGKVLSTMSGIRGCIDRCSLQMADHRLVSSNYTPDKLPADQVGIDLKLFAKNIRVFVTTLEELGEPLDVSGVGDSSTAVLFSPRYQHDAQNFTDNAKKLLMQYQEGWTAIAKKNSAWESWLDRASKASDKMIKDLEDDKKVTPEIRVAWSKALGEERAAISDGMKVIAEAIKLDAVIIDGVAAVAETTHLVSDIIRLRLQMSIAW